MMRWTAEAVDEPPEYWIVYSDLMVSLVMAFVLLLFIALGREQARVRAAGSALQDRASALNRAAEALAREGRSFAFDSASGTLTVDASVLFAFGSADLAPAARRELQAVATVFLPALLREAAVDSLIQDIVIEGHTDTIGTYLDNLRLSQARAFSVMEALLSATSGTSQETRIRQLLTASGRSESQPVVSSGLIDNARSRRIAIGLRFRDDAMLRTLVDSAVRVAR